MKRLTALAALVLVCSLPSVAQASAGPGKFRTTLTGSSARTEQGQLDGTWTIDLASPVSGRLDLTRDGQLKGGGAYVISGSTITLTPKRGGECPSRATYHFSVVGTKLQFKVITDTCAVRRDVLTFKAWTKAN